MSEVLITFLRTAPNSADAAAQWVIDAGYVDDGDPELGDDIRTQFVRRAYQDDWDAIVQSGMNDRLLERHRQLFDAKIAVTSSVLNMLPDAAWRAVVDGFAEGPLTRYFFTEYWEASMQRMYKRVPDMLERARSIVAAREKSDDSP